MAGRWNHHLKIFTDGAKTKEGRCGAAFTIPSRSITHKVRIAGSPTATTCETTAIYLAMKWIEENQCKEVAVMSDSKQALKVICSDVGSQDNILVWSIKKIWKKLKEEGKDVEMVWVKGHSGLSGNEAADLAAKAALHLPETISIQPEPQDLVEKLRKHVEAKWQVLWNSPSTKCGKFYASHTPEVQTKPALFGETRREQTILSKIRMDRLYLNKRKFCEGRRHPSGLCDWCGKEENVHHVILECDQYKVKRNAMLQKLNIPSDQASAKALLDFSDEEKRKVVMEYVIACGILNRRESQGITFSQEE